MIVKWGIDSYEGGEGVLDAYIDPSKEIATITGNGESSFIAHIYEHRYSSKREFKMDDSLIELMNWVEEELKFRMSHEAI